MAELFYLRDSRGDTGSSAIFWSASGGYTTDLSKARKYTRDEAVKQYYSRESDIPVRCDLADNHIYPAVDMQKLRDIPAINSEHSRFAVVIDGRFDGNNVTFLAGGDASKSREHTYSYAEAAIFSLEDVVSNSLSKFNRMALPVDFLNTIARPVVRADLVPTREVLRKAKIKMVKSRRARPTTGKHRSNCPGCGRIVWDHNPYEAVFCKMCD